jgi:hypothetical protein
MNEVADKLREDERDLAIVERVLRAAVGLGHGTDWNNGTHAKLHGYRQQLLDALPSGLEALARLQDRATRAESDNGH